MLIALASVVVIASIVGAVLLNQVHYTVLYSELDASEAGTIKTLLDGKGVNSKVQGTSTILVPEDQADTLRIELAAEGYPSTGLNYDIFSGSSAIGSTDLERRTLLQYQLQENLRTTIRHMEKVKDAIVIVNLAQESSFVVSENTSESSVAVELSLKEDETLTNTEAKTIQELVLKAVPNLKPENVSIVDSKMNYYDVNDTTEEENTEAYSATQQQLTEQMKDVLTKQVQKVLEPAVGSGNVAVSVNLNLDFDKQTVSKVEFAPPVDGNDNGMLRSSQEIYNGVNPDAGASGAAGTATNGSGTPAYVAPSPSPAEGTESYTKTYNYELNQIQTQIEKAQGAVKDLSVAVLVNSSVEGIGGYSENIKNLVAKSIGVTPDYISVELIPFAASNGGMNDLYQQSQQTMEQLSRNKLITTVVTAGAVLAAVVVVAWFFFRKPKRLTEEQALAAGGTVVGVTAGELAELTPDMEYEMADLVLKKSTEAEKIEELMDRYPETVAQILRTWLAEDN